MTVSENKVVHMHYELRNAGGEILDSSAGRDPLAYIHGLGNIIPGLEKELLNKTVGDKIKAVVNPEEGYGTRDESKVFTVQKSQFQGDGELEIGLQIQIEMGGNHEIGVVSNISGEDVTLDLNHPLAGETLYFDVEIMEIREATSQELSHGHVHGPGGHHH